MARSSKGKAAKRVKKGRIPRYAPKLEKQLLSIVKKAEENNALPKVVGRIPKVELIEPKEEKDAEKVETMDTNQPESEIKVKEEVMSDAGSIMGVDKGQKAGFKKHFTVRQMRKRNINKNKAKRLKVVHNATKCLVYVCKKQKR
ncbi:uncharacterized protein LOC134767707 [Penaeus indicus]|uniref:uncharacterized protein LOC134767707 n=1 Tax=Penaeus indicus TaxID=29960 RepID=UPI00300CF4C2